MKIAPLASSRSLRPCPRPGAGSDQQGQAHTIEDLLGIGTDLHPGQQRESAVVEFHHHTLERLQCRLDLEQPQLDRTVRAQQRAAGQAEQQAVADLAGGAGNGDLEGLALTSVLLLTDLASG